MSHLNRYYSKHAANVWELEGRWMRANGTFRAPAAIQWIATSACDLTCNHCYSEAGPRGADELTTAEALALVDAIANTGCEQLVIAGGEPLLRKDLDQVVAHAASRGLRWALHSHGGLVGKRLELFEQHPPAMVAISVDGPPAVHDAIRGRKGAFEDALEAMQLLRDLGCEAVVAGTTVSRLNADHLVDLAPLIADSAAHNWGLHLFAPEGRGSVHRALLPTPGQLRRVAAFCQRKRRSVEVDLDNEWGSAGDLDPLYRNEPFLCGAGRFTAVIAANGDIMPCTTTDPAEAEGNVRTHDLVAVWRDGFGRFRGDGTDAACADGQDCWLQTRNGNSCRKAAFGITTAEPPLPSLPAPRSRPSGALRWAAVAALSAQSALAAPPVEASICATEELPVLSLRQYAQHADRRSSWKALKQKAVVSAAPPDNVYPALASMLTPGPKSDAVLLAGLEEARAAEIWDAWLVGAVWARMSRSEPAPEVLKRLAFHSRMAFALTMTMEEVGPVQFLPWRRKSAPPAGYQALQASPGFHDAFAKHFAAGDRSSWATQATLPVQVVNGPAQVCRNGQTLTAKPGTRIQLARLEWCSLPEGTTLAGPNGRLLAQGPTVITTRTLLPPGPAYRPTDQRALEAAVKAVTSGSNKDLAPLEQALPLMADAIRQALAEHPDGKGAPALRQLLYLWDE